MKRCRIFFHNPLHYAEAALLVFLTGIIFLPMILNSDFLTKTCLLPETFRRELYEFFIGNIPETYGILWFLCFLLILAAFVLEFYWKPHAGMKKKIALTGYSLAILFVLFNLFAVNCNDYSETARRISCIRGLKIIGLSLNQYAMENSGYFPSDLETIDIDKALFRCPSGRKDSVFDTTYFYHGKGKKNTDEAFIIVEDRPKNHPGIFRGILYSNGQAGDARVFPQQKRSLRKDAE